VPRNQTLQLSCESRGGSQDEHERTSSCRKFRLVGAANKPQELHSEAGGVRGSRGCCGLVASPGQGHECRLLSERLLQAGLPVRPGSVQLPGLMHRPDMLCLFLRSDELPRKALPVLNARRWVAASAATQHSQPTVNQVTFSDSQFIWRPSALSMARHNAQKVKGSYPFAAAERSSGRGCSAARPGASSFSGAFSANSTTRRFASV
jgi:hypothetical protein